MNRNYLPVWLALGALLIAVLLAIGVEPTPSGRPHHGMTGRPSLGTATVWFTF